MSSIMLLFFVKVLGTEHKTVYGDVVSSEEKLTYLLSFRLQGKVTSLFGVRKNLISLLELRKDLV